MVSLFRTVCEWSICSEPSVITRLHTVAIESIVSVLDFQCNRILVLLLVRLLTCLFCWSLFSSVQFKMVSMRSEKTHMRPHPQYLRSVPTVAFQTVPIFVWLTMTLSRLFKKDRLALPLFTPLCSRWSRRSLLHNAVLRSLGDPLRSCCMLFWISD